VRLRQLAMPNYDAKFGDAVRQRAGDGPESGGAQRGFDAGNGRPRGQGGRRRYHESFRSPPPVVNVINIGARSAAASEQERPHACAPEELDAGSTARAGRKERKPMK